MNVNTHIGKKKRRLRLGIGTALALLLGIGLAVTGRLATSPNLSPNAGRVVFEADGQGKLRRVDSSSRHNTPPPPLRKPEPSFLLEHAQTLKLSPRQRAEIEALKAHWNEERYRLESELRASISGANASVQSAKSSGGVSTASVTASLGDYSQLSREYEERRANAWRHSFSALTRKQQESLHSLEANERKQQK